MRGGAPRRGNERHPVVTDRAQSVLAVEDPPEHAVDDWGVLQDVLYSVTPHSWLRACNARPERGQ